MCLCKPGVVGSNPIRSTQWSGGRAVRSATPWHADFVQGPASMLPHRDEHFAVPDLLSLLEHLPSLHQSPTSVANHRCRSAPHTISATQTAQHEYPRLVHPPPTIQTLHLPASLPNTTNLLTVPAPRRRPSVPLCRSAALLQSYSQRKPQSRLQLELYPFEVGALEFVQDRTDLEEPRAEPANAVHPEPQPAGEAV